MSMHLRRIALSEFVFRVRSYDAIETSLKPETKAVAKTTGTHQALELHAVRTYTSHNAHDHKQLYRNAHPGNLGTTATHVVDTHSDSQNVPPPSARGDTI